MTMLPWPLIVMGVWLVALVALVIASWIGVRQDDRRAARIDREFCKRYGMKL